MTSFIDDDGNELDYAGNDFALTKQIISIFDLAIKANTSVNIKIPGTASNRNKLNFFGFNQISGNQLISQPFNLIRNGIKMDKGVIVLISDDIETLSVFFASGNFRWFNNLNFLCSEIRTNRWNVRWNNYYLKNSASATEGIIFPLIDWNYRHEKYSKFFCESNLTVGAGEPSGGTGESTVSDLIPETYPCLYIHTLVKELANHSQVNISGTLLSDGLFKRLIITPPGPNFKDPVSGEQVYDGDTTSSGASTEAFGKTIKPEMIAPRIKAIDFIKWLSASFGCVVSFDQTGNAISIDILDKLDKSDAQDWSSYYVSHMEEFRDIKQNNYIKFKTSDDPEIEEYNEMNDVAYGDLNIQSDRDTISERTVYQSPFPAVKDKVGSADLRWACPYVPFVILKDEASYNYTSVTDQGGAAGNPPDDRSIFFNGTGFPFTNSSSNVIVRIEDDNGLYSGFHTSNPIATSTSTAYKTKGRFKGDSTGKIFIQSAEKTSNQYVLVAVPGVDPANFTRSAGIYVFAEELTSVATAYFSKPYTPYSFLNLQNKGLAYGEINESTYYDITLHESYLRPLSKAIVQPTLKVKMVIPFDVFTAFDGSELIYLNVGKLNGYFVVQKIEHYKDSIQEIFVYISSFE